MKLNEFELNEYELKLKEVSEEELKGLVRERIKILASPWKEHEFDVVTILLFIRAYREFLLGEPSAVRYFEELAPEMIAPARECVDMLMG